MRMNFQQEMTRPIRGRLYVGNLAALLLLTATPAWAKGGTIVYDQAGMNAPATVQVTSPAFSSGGSIPVGFSAYGANRSIPMQWSGAPGNTASFAVVVQDPDAPPANPVVHWIAWNIPAGTTALPPGIAGGVQGSPGNMRQGLNTPGGTGYYGPHPPANDPPHHYHVQVYALDRRLDLPQGSTIDQLTAAMMGHVEARGELVGLFGWPVASTN